MWCRYWKLRNAQSKHSLSHKETFRYLSLFACYQYDNTHTCMSYLNLPVFHCQQTKQMKKGTLPKPDTHICCYLYNKLCTSWLVEYMYKGTTFVVYTPSTSHIHYFTHRAEFCRRWNKVGCRNRDYTKLEAYSILAEQSYNLSNTWNLQAYSHFPLCATQPYM